MILAAAAPPFFAEVTALLVAGAAIAYVAVRAGLVPIVGFLLAGVLIGPHALGLVRRPELVDAAAEVGVVLLLFTIGIEFSLEKLARIRRLIFLGGGVQVTLATAVTTAVLALLGVPWQVGVFTGFLVALSSTSIVLKLLADRGETDEAHGQVALGMLIFQDLAVVAMVLLVPVLGGVMSGAGEIVWALGKAAGIIAAVLLLARRLVPAVLEVVARTCSPEIFLLTVVAMCFGTAYLTSLAGVSLSLGAFLAGLLVSESRFGEHALGEILPLQVLFTATFFVSVGMLLDLRFLLGNLPLVLLAVGAVLLVKVATTGAAVLALGRGAPLAAASGLVLAQVGEFSFVLERAGREVGLFPAGMAELGSQTFIAATVVLMVFTPQMSAMGVRWARTRGAPDTDPDRTEVELPRGPVGSDQVIVAGYGQAARTLVSALAERGVPYVVTTLSPGGAREAEAGGSTVFRGDATKAHALGVAGVTGARVLVVPDDTAATARRVVAVARGANPDLYIIARTRFAADGESLRHAGADAVVSEEDASARALVDAVLEAYGAVRAGAHDRSAVPAGPPVPADPLEEDDMAACQHVKEIRNVEPRTPEGCEDCLREGARWVHLRLCLTCGHVGCCDSSPNRHATRHFHDTEHPIVRSFEPGEDWRWCFVDRQEV